MNHEKIRKKILKVLVASLLFHSLSTAFPLRDPWLLEVHAAEAGTVSVKASSLWTYARPDWNAKIEVVHKGAVLQVAEKILVAGREMYRLSNGRFVTANTAYVSYLPASAVPAAVIPSTSAEVLLKTTAALNMRAGDSTAYKVVTVLPKGTVLSSSKQAQNGWYYVSFQGKSGYVSNRYVSAVSSTSSVSSPPAAPAAPAAYVTTTASLNLRSGSSTSYGVLAVLASGTTLPVSGQASNGWYQVSYQGKSGYVSNGYVRTADHYSEMTLSVPYINQYDPLYAPMGCEGATLLMALQYKGYTKASLKTFLDAMPKTERNPFKGFASTPYAVIKGTPPIFQSIFPEALTAYGKTYHENVIDFSGASTDQLKEELNKGNPVAVYVTTRNFEAPLWKVYDMGDAGMVNIVDNMHIMLLTGFNSNGEYQVTDPANSKKVYWVSANQFETAYNALKWAIVIR